ncbi:NUDIX hydrolase [Alkalihalobacillus sp. CinArs1]|uniref:NUDIX hydrolase n=1 Tax=Alkalihalobacillus sp. CinArs1 TaxID=2995314 RepID=UPI0022DDAD73|nr:NUDIX domain-containing protein [Alkalihalobacillus sp. CinArs1]
MRTRSAAIILEDDRVALIKRVRNGDVYYVFPGGGVEKGESKEQAAIREVHEELGVTVSLTDLYAEVDFNGKQYYYLAQLVGGEFGTGMGEEYQLKETDRGTYEPVWIELNELNGLDVKPAEVARSLYSLRKTADSR